jgi:hypothetical protein
VAWLRRHWPRKLVVKGILGSEDARLAVELGADGICVLETMEGRQLDGAPAPLAVLPRSPPRSAGRPRSSSTAACGRGADIVKALALGADLVLRRSRSALRRRRRRRERGVRRALQILKVETDRVLALLGCIQSRSSDHTFLHGSRSPRPQTRAVKVDQAAGGLDSPAWASIGSWRLSACITASRRRAQRATAPVDPFPRSDPGHGQPPKRGQHRAARRHPHPGRRHPLPKGVGEPPDRSRGENAAEAGREVAIRRGCFAPRAISREDLGFLGQQLIESPPAWSAAARCRSAASARASPRLASTRPTSALIFSTSARGTAADVRRPNQSVDS